MPHARLVRDGFVVNVEVAERTCRNDGLWLCGTGCRRVLLVIGDRTDRPKTFE